MSKKSDNKRLPFTVDARIIAQLGEQLVPSDLMALAELVKNSYDADATVVSIDYREASNSRAAEIVVEDDGNGMSLDQLRDGWMHIGTAAKERVPRSPRYGRPCAGIKGVGRFAAQRLGDQLILTTSPRENGVAYKVTFDWTGFTAGRALDSILHDVEEKSASEADNGTTLTISKLKRDWSMEDLVEVIKDLTRLHVPDSAPREVDNADEIDPGFQVAAALHDKDGVEVIDELDLLREERVMHLHGEVSESGVGTYRLEFYRPEREQKSVKFPHQVTTGPLDFDLDLAIFSSKWIEELGVRRAQAIGRKHGGVRVWRDGFRVFPFGEPGDDWLGIEERIAARREPLNLWRNQGMLGGVRISRESNPGLQDLLTRRGMIETAAFKSLKDFLLEGLIIAATEHAAVSERKTRSTRQKPKPSEALKSAIDAASADDSKPDDDAPDDTHPPAKATGDGKTSGVDPDLASRLLRVVRQAERELISENQMLKVLASLGTGLAVFAHEMKTVSLDVAVSAKELDELSVELPAEEGQRVGTEVRRLRSGIESLSTYARYVEDFVSAESRVRRHSVEISEFIRDFFSVFSPLLDRRDIAYDLRVPRGLWTCALFRAELISIFFNLLTNAVKALLAPGVRTRRIAIVGRKEDEMIVTTVADSGCGIPDDVVDELFEPFVTRAHNPGDDALGRGTGLGLYVVREMLGDYEGSIDVVDAPEGFTTAIQVRLPARRAGA